MRDTGELVGWSGLLLVIAVPAAILCWLVARTLKRRLLEHQSSPLPFTIQDLRDMRARGQITQQEFEVMRAAVIRQFAAREQAEPSADATPENSADPDAPGPPPE
jgi:hypothetical protein